MKYIFHWFLEFTLVIFHGPLTLLNLVLPFNPEEEFSYDTPVILVERWFKKNPLHFLMKRYLGKRGFTVHSINFPLLEGDFRQSALDLKKFIEENNLPSVILIGISGGGLTCYQYLTDFGGWERTKLFVAIGTPFKGAVASFLLPFKKPKEELSPGSRYTEYLLNKPLTHKEKIYCLAAKYDQMVGHDNSFLPGANNETIDVAGHNVIHTIWVPTFRKIRELCMTCQ